LVAVISGDLSKLRAGRLTLAGAASLLSCAGAPSFFAPGAGAVFLVWGALEVIGGPWFEKTLQLTVRSTRRNRFIEFAGQRADFEKSLKLA
jgi:hypothetical protein